MIMNYAAIKKFDIANGTGIRTSLFVSGCRHHCPGCFNALTWDFSYGKEFSKEVEDEIIESLNDENIEGLSLLGGEPFEPENQAGLINLLRRVVNLYPNKNIWCYTGYTFDTDLKEGGKVYTKYTKEMLSYIDILVDGEFKMELKDLKIKFRGSSNQRIIDVKTSLRLNKTIIREDLMFR